MSQGVKFTLQGRKTLRRKSRIFTEMILLVLGALTCNNKKTNCIVHYIVSQLYLLLTEPLKNIYISIKIQKCGFLLDPDQYYCNIILH